MRRFFSVLITLSLTILLFSGCYDNKEIDSLATVMAVGIENEEGERLYTFSVADSGGFTNESKGDGASMKCFKQKAKNLKDATAEVNKQLSKSLGFSHLSAIVFSAECAKEDLSGELSFFENQVSVRPQTMIAISHLKPSDYLEKLSPVLEVNPEKYFQKVFGDSKRYVSYLRLCDFTNAYHTDTTCLAPVITGNSDKKTISEDDIKINSSALIWKGKSIAEIDDNWFLGLVLSDKSVKYDKMEIQRTQKPKFDFKLTKSKLKVGITLKVKSDGKLNKKKAKKDAEEFLRNSSKDMLDTINVKQLVKKIFFLQKKYEGYNWDEIIKNAEFNVKFKVV